MDAFFKEVQQQTIGKVGNSMCLWADNFVCNSERIIKIGQCLRKLCSNEKVSSFFSTNSVYNPQLTPDLLTVHITSLYVCLC